ncbi:RES family NAD+ phosphorylase [Rheinheimera sp. YQF-2]|uniref:RES family NAD+ phosphorylase n=1 Tax=Rheinheimera lutimaris TaxID=2740584 RepID=A0A7Y5AQS3_9GAMM|nr:RES family NAD+ phosphorylase [Rheinheimera lutimaris]NRQ42822.1 RES family NAD+ phosphorylase [Rheinheimera lutimaris]
MPDKKWILDLDDIHNRANEIKNSKAENFISDGLEYVLRFYDIINFDFRYERAFLRARHVENGQPYTHTSEIYYPPPHRTKPGRLNEAGFPFLYLSLTLDTALTEIGAQTGDILQISAYRPKDRPIKVGVIGEKYRASRGASGFLPREVTKKLLDIVNELEREDRKKAFAYLYPDLFFDEILRDPEAKQSEYLHSRILTKLIFEKQKDLDGIAYHSVASYGNKNIALPACKADELLGLENTVLVKVKKSYSYGLHDVAFLKAPKDIRLNGDIIW